LCGPGGGAAAVPGFGEGHHVVDVQAGGGRHCGRRTLGGRPGDRLGSSEGLSPAPVPRLQAKDPRRRTPRCWQAGAPGADASRGRAADLPALASPSRLHRVRCLVHRRTVEGGRARRLGRFSRAPPVSVRGLRPAVRHDLQQAWPDEPRHEERGQGVPEQKAGGTWLSRFRR
jgi:hypothetical protein